LLRIGSRDACLLVNAGPFAADVPEDFNVAA
jgi:hypothetical protein